MMDSRIETANCEHLADRACAMLNGNAGDYLPSRTQLTKGSLHESDRPPRSDYRPLPLSL